MCCDVVVDAGDACSGTEISRRRTEPAQHRPQTPGALRPSADALRLQHAVLGQLPRLSVHSAVILLSQLPTSVPGRRAPSQARPDWLCATHIAGRRQTVPAYHRATCRHAETVHQELWRLEVLLQQPAAVLPGWLRSHRFEQSLPRILPATTTDHQSRCLWRRPLTMVMSLVSSWLTKTEQNVSAYELKTLWFAFSDKRRRRYLVIICVTVFNVSNFVSNAGK